MTRRRKRTCSIVIGVLLAASLSSARPVPTPTPTPVPPRASENPEDSRARMPRRPTPFEPESKFPPPQQSEQEEERTANKPGEPELLHGEPAIFLDGVPFPEKKLYEPKFPEAKRLLYVDAAAAGPGEGSAERPWNDLQHALCTAQPGDRLVVAAGIYTGAFRATASAGCRDGTADAPIQFFARHAFFRPSGKEPVLTLDRAHWQFWETQFALTDTDAPGLVVRGPGAHDIALDQSHIYEGTGPALVLAAGSSRITVSHCHIHHSSGVRIEPGASEVTLINNHLHHNHAASISVGLGPAGPPARAIRILGSRVNNDHGPAISVGHAEDVTLSRNRLSNYRPDDEEGFAGEAVRIGSGARHVSFDGGSILEATIAVRIGGSDAGAAPDEISFSRSFFQNALTPESTAWRIESGRGIRFVNDVVDRYALPLEVAAAARDVSVANDVFFAPKQAFSVASPASLALFDYVAFGSAGALSASVGGKTVRAADWVRAHMPHSRLVPDLAMDGGDLAKIRGFDGKDAGKAVDGSPFSGSAPDVGVAEH